MQTPKSASYAGKSVDRVEGRDKVTGRAHYAADTQLADLTYGVLVQSEVPHGAVTAESIRASVDRASQSPGVLDVLNPLNCPPLQVLPRELTFDLPLERRPPLSDLTVQHVGQHMALIVADTLENATAAASLFALEYQTRDALLSAREVIDGTAEPDEKDGQIRHGSYLPDHFVKLDDEKLQDRRDAGTRQPEVRHRVSARFTTPVNAHYPIELASTIAAWNGDELTVHDSTRWITGERRALAAYMDMPQDKVRVLSPLVGGAFGSKNFLWMHVVLAAVAARRVRRPVKVVLTRDQMFSSTGHRPQTEQDIVLAADAEGHLTSTEHHTLTETSTIAHFCEPAGLSTRFLYRSPSLVVSHRTARINAPTPCFMRGPGEAPGLFALEVAMDELADEVGIDPVELRIRNHVDFDQTNGRPWSGEHLLQCYESGMQRFGWSGRPAPRALHRNGVQVGWGMATATYPGRRMPASCRVSTTDDGRVRFASATHEVGNGVRTVMTQLAVDATGLTPTQVEFASGDSHFPDAPYSGASQTTASVGSSVQQAACEWRGRLLALLTRTGSSPFFDIDPADLEIIGGEVRSARGDARSAPVESLLRTCDPAWREQLNFTVSNDAADQDAAPSQSFGAHFCEIEVDEQLGRATVVRWVAVMDCGRVLNPKLARNQVMGGITFGLGMALLERVPYDSVTAQLIGEYYLPTHADRPDFDISFIDTPDYGLDPIGVRGIGEIGTCGVPAAIANAIFHATGKRHRALPIMLEDLMAPYVPTVEEK